MEETERELKEERKEQEERLERGRKERKESQERIEQTRMEHKTQEPQKGKEAEKQKPPQEHVRADYDHIVDTVNISEEGKNALKFYNDVRGTVEIEKEEAVDIKTSE